MGGGVSLVFLFDASKTKRGARSRNTKEKQNTVPPFVHTLASSLSPSHKTPLPARSRCSSVSSSVACSALQEEWPVRVCVVQLRGRSAQLAASLCVSQSLAGFLKWFVSAAFRTGFNH